MSTPNGAVYQIVQSKRVLDQLQELHQTARSQGFGPAVVSAARQIFARLELNPEGFGEPRFSLRHANLEIRALAVAPLLVNYAVHRERHIVFIRDFALLPQPNL